MPPPAIDSDYERPESHADLGFTPQPTVRWFSPTELVRAGTKAVLSSLFGAYADWREVQALRAALSSGRDDRMTTGTARTVTGNGGTHEWYDLSDRDALWLDYTADLGDGFDATYTVARLLAERRLEVAGHPTERGQVLVMGGDQVYPTASRTEYTDRLVGPYRAALPWVLDATPPLLFAVPGNHDWYDGLTSFLRQFTQGRWIGGWKTAQRRSYFALKLPHDWWLWGIDVQLASDIDEPQLDYFRALASDPAVMPPGSKVVLCTPEPSWLYAETEGPEAYRNLRYFEDEVLTANGHEMTVGLAGDLHMYARYAEADTGRQRFVAGGGGAYLYPTHDLPDTLTVETPEGRDRFTMQRDGDGDSRAPVFPSRSISRRLSWGALLLPFKNPSFGVVLAALYLLFGWLVQSASVVPSFAPESDATSLLEYMADADGLGAVLQALETIVKHAPGAVLLVVVLWGGLSAFADLKSTPAKAGLGAVHAAAHLLLAVALMWGCAVLNLAVGLSPWGVHELPHVLLFSGEMLVVGGVLGGGLMGGYLLLTNRLFRLVGVPGVHANELFSCQHIPDYKHVLRLHIGDDGGLTLYPIGISSVETHWSLRPDGAPEDAWFEGDVPVTERAELIEPPVRVG